jgi:hypothetical protein
VDSERRQAFRARPVRDCIGLGTWQDGRRRSAHAGCSSALSWPRRPAAIALAAAAGMLAAACNGPEPESSQPSRQASDRASLPATALARLPGFLPNPQPGATDLAMVFADELLWVLPRNAAAPRRMPISAFGTAPDSRALLPLCGRSRHRRTPSGFAAPMRAVRFTRCRTRGRFRCRSLSVCAAPRQRSIQSASTINRCLPSSSFRGRTIDALKFNPRATRASRWPLPDSGRPMAR